MSPLSWAFELAVGLRSPGPGGAASGERSLTAKSRSVARLASSEPPISIAKRGDLYTELTVRFLLEVGFGWPYTALPSLSHGLSHIWWAPLLPPAEPQPPPLLTAIAAA